MSVATARTRNGESARDRSLVYVELTKPRITLMVLLTVAAGFYLAHGMGTGASVLGMLHALVGTGLACSGSGALNQYLERDTDGHMNRTRFRPLPAQRVQPRTVLALGTLLCATGVSYLAITTNAVAAGLNALTVVAYLFVYTPMKRVSPASTLVGAIPGALPPVIGWAAARGTVDAGGWILFGILFLWQVPHFLAIGRMYREDYADGGLPMLVVVDSDGGVTGRQMVLYAAFLIPVSLLLTAAGITGALYFWAALALGGVYLGYSVRAARSGDVRGARSLLLCSVIYLPLLSAAITLDRLLA